MNFPIVRIELEHLRQSVVHAFTDLQLKQDEMFQEAVKVACDPARLQILMQEMAKQEIDKAIKDEIHNFFTYGEGGKQVAKLVLKKLREKTS